MQAFCGVTVHMQVATRVCTKGQGVDFIARPCIWEVSITNLWHKPPQMVQKTSAVYPDRELLGLLQAGNMPGTVNLLAP